MKRKREVSEEKEVSEEQEASSGDEGVTDPAPQKKLKSDAGTDIVTIDDRQVTLFFLSTVQ